MAKGNKKKTKPVKAVKPKKEIVKPTVKPVDGEKLIEKSEKEALIIKAKPLSKEERVLVNLEENKNFKPTEILLEDDEIEEEVLTIEDEELEEGEDISIFTTVGVSEIDKEEESSELISLLKQQTESLGNEPSITEKESEFSSNAIDKTQKNFYGVDAIDTVDDEYLEILTNKLMFEKGFSLLAAKAAIADIKSGFKEIITKKMFQEAFVKIFYPNTPQVESKVEETQKEEVKDPNRKTVQTKYYGL